MPSVGGVGSKSCLGGQEPLMKVTLDMGVRLGVSDRLL